MRNFIYYIKKEITLVFLQKVYAMDVSYFLFLFCLFTKWHVVIFVSPSVYNYYHFFALNLPLGYKV